ncbi:polysaccharide deacetylase family protein [Microbacterium deminutum]|uniref:polysaccharide deacetylase family protein n=1 Tax=Microbacterium deminutum TaxID=344164 RepID=UPI0031DA2582
MITLNFHGIGTPRRVLEPGEERFWITHDQYLQVLDVALAHSRRVEITFDDANESDYELGLQALLDRGIAARFFIITDRIGEDGSLSAGQLAEMAACGMTFGTHGASHRPWTDLARTGELSGELNDSSSRLTRIVGEAIKHAAFPQGLYNRAVLKELRARKFTRAYSVDEGWSREHEWLRTRYSVIHSDTAATVARLLDSPTLTSDPWPLRPAKQALKRWR